MLEDLCIFDWVKDGQTFTCVDGEFKGQQLDKKELERMFTTQLFLTSSEEITYANSMGLSVELIAQKYKSETYNCIKIKPNAEFGKVFRVNARELALKSNMSEKCWAFISKTEPFIAFPTNSIVIKGSSPTLEELSKFMGYGQSKLYETLKELEDNEVIKRIKIKGNTIIYFNPFLYCSGKVVLTEVYNYFEDSQYNI